MKQVSSIGISNENFYICSDILENYFSTRTFLNCCLLTEMDDDTVRDHFSECGNVTGVRIVRDRKTGIGKGFGYVLFEVCNSYCMFMLET